MLKEEGINVKLKQRILSILLCASTISGFTFSSATAFAVGENRNDLSSNTEVDESVVDTVCDAIDSPQKAVGIINDIHDKATYEEALRTVLDKYYLNSNQKNIDIISDSTDSRAKEIIENYEEASAERQTDVQKLGYMSGEVLAVVKSGIEEEDIPKLLEDGRMNVVAVSDYVDGKKLVKLGISLEDTVDAAVKKLEQNIYVEYVQKDYVYKSESIYTQELINDEYADSLFYLNAVKASEAWAFVEGVPHEKIKVGIIDTGAQLDHPDLKNIINKDLSVRITCDGIIAPLRGDNGIHGTHVSGIVAAQANNEIGVAGTASAVNNDLVELVEIGSDTGTGNNLSAFVIYKAIRYAIDNNIRVINMSLGGATDPDNIFQSAVDLAIKSGCVVVCAAGNENSSDYAYPSDCNGAISVIALDENCTDRAAFSNYGGTSNKVSAPGTGILSTLPESYGEYNYKRGYEKLSGTSMATPIVAAEAAMILSVNPKLTSTAVKDIIYNTCTDMGEKGYDADYGYGIIDINNAVQTAYKTITDDMPEAVSLTESSITLLKGDSHKVSAHVTSIGNNKSVYYHVEDSGVAKISQDGIVTGITCGETKIVVSTENSITAECIIKVESPGREKLATPVGESIQTGVYTGARISWSEIENADFYQIYATTGDSDDFTYIGSTTINSYAASLGMGGEEVPASSITKYKIKAVNNTSEYADSDFSNEFVYLYVGQEPYLMANQILEQGKDAGLLIHWSAIVCSHLYRTSSLDGEKKLLADFGEDMTKNYYEDTDLVNGVTYTYTLQLYTVYKGKEYSDISTDIEIEYYDDDPLDTSLGKCEIKEAQFKNNKASIQFTPAGNSIVSQCLVSDNNGKSWFDAFNFLGSGNSFVDLDGVEFGKTYLVKVKSFDGELTGLYRRRSEYSETITVTMPEALEKVEVEAEMVNSTLTHLTWNKTVDADYYTVYRKNNGVWETLYNKIYDTSCFDSTITKGNIYYYKVVPQKQNPDFKAVDSTGRSYVKTIEPQSGEDSNIVKINTINENTKYIVRAVVDEVPEQTFTGGEVCPEIKAYYDGKLLEAGTDYYVEYYSNTSAGKGYALLTGVGVYQGQRYVPFTIVNKSESKSYKVTYKNYDGSVISVQTVKEGEVPAKIQPPYREGYVFSGWDKDIDRIYSDVTLTAQYVADNKMFNVAFLDKEGNVVDRQKVAYGESAKAPAAKEYDGYSFVGWSQSITYITKSMVVKPVYKAVKFAGGKGSTQSPYLISDIEQLKLFSSLVNSSDLYAKSSYKLTADIKYNDLANCGYWANDNVNNEENRPDNVWTPAGTEQRPFSGCFDGNGHSISGLYVFTSDDYAGFIGYAENAYISSLKLEQTYINNQKGYAGALVGKFVNTSAENSGVHACCVTQSNIIANSVAGGMIGELESTSSNGLTEISDCYSEDSYVFSMWEGIVGGLIGRVNSNGGNLMIKYCFAYNEIFANHSSKFELGVIIGEFNTTYDNNAWCDIKDCYFEYNYYPPIYAYDDLYDNSGAYSFENIVGFEYSDGKTDASGYELKQYNPNESKNSDYMWVFNANETPSLYFEKPYYLLEYYLDGELVSQKYYHEGDITDNPERYYSDGYISTDWVFSEDDFNGIMPGCNVKATAHKYMCGDVDNNGQVNINDTTIIQRYLADLVDFDAVGIISADVNGDGVVDVSDCTETQKFLSQQIDTLKGSEIPEPQLFDNQQSEYITITIKDGTSSKWLPNSNAEFLLIDNATGTSYEMVYSDGVWTVTIPDTVESITIQRKDPSSTKVWNSWNTEINGTQFTIVDNNTGIWKSTDENVTITLVDGTSNKWLSNNSAEFDIVDNETSDVYKMEYTNGVWIATVPGTVSDITIRRKNPQTGDVWNSWKTTCVGTTFTVTGSSGSWS